MRCAACWTNTPSATQSGETYLATPEKIIAYCGPDKLHAAFSFDFTSSNLVFPWQADWVRQKISEREARFGAAQVWPTTVMGNHDLPRPASRYCRGEDDTQAFNAMALLLTLPGTPFLYYGDEIGMRDISLKRSEILDPPGKKYWPVYKGRDGCRSPMQWDASANAGFSAARPWLPVHPNYTRRSVLAQSQDLQSLFVFTQKLLALRKSHPALRRGGLDFLPGTPPQVLAYLRQSADQTLLVACNFSSSFVTFPLPAGKWEKLLFSGQSARPGELLPGQVYLLEKQVER